MRFPRRIIAIALSCIIVGSFSTSVARAAYTQDDSYFNSNNILFECKPSPDNSCANNTCSTAESSTTGSGVQAASLSDLKKSDTLQSIFQDLINGGMNAVQAAAVMGNMYTESYDYIDQKRFDPDFYEGGVKTADDGYGLVQWSFGRRTNLFNFAQQQGSDVKTIDTQIKFLLAEYDGKIPNEENYGANLKSTAFGDGKNVTDATVAWMKVYEDPLQKQGDPDPAKINSERIPAAIKIYGFYSNLSSGATADATTDATSGSCTGGAGDSSGTGDEGGSAVAGSIVKTALNYAWPTPVANGVNQKSQARQSYQTDKPKYDDEGLFSDCGAFVSTVMRASGLDTNFPKLGVHLMGPYVRAHPDTYKIIEHATTSQMQPGDILIEYSFDHIEISLGGVKSVDASNTQRVPSVRPTGGQYMQGEGAFIARYIGGK